MTLNFTTSTWSACVILSTPRSATDIRPRRLPPPAPQQSRQPPTPRLHPTTQAKIQRPRRSLPAFPPQPRPRRTKALTRRPLHLPQQQPLLQLLPPPPLAQLMSGNTLPPSQGVQQQQQSPLNPPTNNLLRNTFVTKDSSKKQVLQVDSSKGSRYLNPNSRTTVVWAAVAAVAAVRTGRPTSQSLQFMPRNSQ